MGTAVETSLERTRGGFFGAVRNLFRARPRLEDAFFLELEELLIRADVGAYTSAELVETLRALAKGHGITTAADAQRALQDEMVRLLDVGDRRLRLPPSLAVVLVVGVNGVGKTTFIAKLAAHLREREHRRCLLAAGDTFRAAAIDQLKEWGDRIQTPVVAQLPGADPGAVLFDAIQAAQRRGFDCVIADTAGRLHTKSNLMEELKKVRRVAERQLPGAPHEVLLVLDAITGQNALQQARSFLEAVHVTGFVVAKLDSTAKGGVVFSIVQELKLPIKFVGTGERTQDLAPFEPRDFVRALFES